MVEISFGLSYNGTGENPGRKKKKIMEGI